MKYNLLKHFALATILLCIATSIANAQTKASPHTAEFKSVAAGSQYSRSGFYQWLWGQNYRKEWTKEVLLPVIYLDTLRGGLIKYKEGGSNQSKSLQLTTAGDKQYALRSVDKTLDKVIPKIFHGTFVSSIVNDAISMSNPYGALVVPKMAEAIGVLHTVPTYYYLPRQKALDTLNNTYGGKVYLFEQRPKGDWNDADNLGNFKEFDDTEDMMPNLLRSSLYSVDQPEFIKARLLDMLVGDFDRHADQWKWGIKKDGDKTIYIPVPTDRDQALSTHNGFLLNLVIRMAGLKFLQRFNYDIPNVKALVTINRVLDRLVTNKMTLAQWQAEATKVQALLTDAVIDSAVQNMPPEIVAIRGKEIAAKLKSRRGHLMEYATKYYGVMAEESEVVGTSKSEYFEVNHLAENNTEVKVYNIDARGNRDTQPFYNRTFINGETDEIRLYGLAGNDVYKVTGEINRRIKLRIIGGVDKDSIIDKTTNKGTARLHVYDNADNNFGNGNRKLHLSEDSAVHVYDYNSFLPDKKGLVPHLIYNDDDRIFLGVRYQFLNHRWRKRPYAYRQSVDVDYSITQKAFSTTYNGLFPKLFGQWDLITRANYDGVRWLNFHGLGNETPNITDDRDFYRMRSEEGSVNLGVGRLKGKNKWVIGSFYQRVKIINDTARFIFKNISPTIAGVFTPDKFAGLQVAYDYTNVKETFLPEKGVAFSLLAKHTQNLDASDRSFQTLGGSLSFFVPVVPKLSFAVKTGGTSVVGTPLFYQYPNIGQSYNLRGFRRERFSGKSNVYNNTELRYIKKVRSKIFNGKAGLLAFVDHGRVWMPGETSDTWHRSFGGGILVSPFNLTSIAVTYAVSDELNMLQFRVGMVF